MDLAHPLTSLVPSLDSAVLEVLAGTEQGLSASRIARLAPRGTRAGQAPVLDRLVEHGVVLADPAGQGYLYRLNREHMLAPVILVAARARVAIFERLAGAIAALDPEPVHASVFGSFARGEAGSDSDIDILVVTARRGELPAWDEQVRALEGRVLTWTGNRCHALAFDLARVRALARDREPIAVNWLNDAVLVFGQPLRSLLSEADVGRGSNAGDSK